MAHGQIYWIGVIFCGSNNSTRLHKEEHGKKPSKHKEKNPKLMDCEERKSVKTKNKVAADGP